MQTNTKKEAAANLEKAEANLWGIIAKL